VEWIFGWQVIGFLFGWMLGKVPAVVRWSVGPGWLGAEVHESAQAAFLRHGLTETRDRTGVLIYISLYEHRVEILADKGIHSKVGEGFWRDEVAKITRGIREKKGGAVTAQVIREIGGKLAEHFPQLADDKNELTNQVRGE
jgi:putative membrane protein